MGVRTQRSGDRCVARRVWMRIGMHGCIYMCKYVCKCVYKYRDKWVEICPKICKNTGIYGPKICKNRARFCVKKGVCKKKCRRPSARNVRPPPFFSGVELGEKK